MSEGVRDTTADQKRAAAEENIVRRIFRISLILKAIDSAIELLAGAALYLISGTAIMGWVHWLTRRELLEDPRDFIANFLVHSAESLSVGHKTMASLYLASHGAIKLFLVIMVLREKWWAYPVFIAALALLIGYQSYQLTYGFSLWLAALTVLDLVVLVLTWHEWQLHRRTLAARA